MIRTLIAGDPDTPTCQCQCVTTRERQPGVGRRTSQAGLGCLRWVSHLIPAHKNRRSAQTSTGQTASCLTHVAAGDRTYRAVTKIRGA